MILVFAPAIPVTILTGYLGSGKTTLLNRMLNSNRGLRIAVIENEAGEIGIDQDLVIRSAESLIATNDGCVCCSVREDLVEALDELLASERPFDRIVIETSGLADPAPVAQTCFHSEDFRRRLKLDGIVTLVDARHIGLHLGESAEARKQIALADRLIINKSDLVTPSELDALDACLERMNPMAPRLRATRAEVPVDSLLAIGGFDQAGAFNLDSTESREERLFGWAGLFQLEPGQFEAVAAEAPDWAEALVCLPLRSASAESLRGAENTAESLFAGPLKLLQPGDAFRPAAIGWQLSAVDPLSHYEWRVEEAGLYAVFLAQPPSRRAVSLLQRDRELKPIVERRYWAPHQHQEEVGTVSIEEPSPFDGDALATYLTMLLRVRGPDLFRVKGVLHVAGMAERFVLQAVHMLLDGGPDRPWADGELRASRIVFIGRNLDRAALLAGLRSCIARPLSPRDPRSSDACARSRRNGSNGSGRVVPSMGALGWRKYFDGAQGRN